MGRSLPAGIAINWPVTMSCCQISAVSVKYLTTASLVETIVNINGFQSCKALKLISLRLYEVLKKSKVSPIVTLTKAIKL